MTFYFDKNSDEQEKFIEIPVTRMSGEFCPDGETPELVTLQFSVNHKAADVIEFTINSAEWCAFKAFGDEWFRLADESRKAMNERASKKG